MSYPFVQIDAFTNKAFSGNPAAVFLLEEEKPEAWMQQVAAEMNVSETAFLLKVNDKYLIRWFTPEAEAQFCGHATLASAHALWESETVEPSQTIRFESGRGLLHASKKGEWIEMDFPAISTKPCTPPACVQAFLANTYTEVLGNKDHYYIVPIQTQTELLSLSPDWREINAPPYPMVIFTTQGDGEFDFVSRVFAPYEDPVTGSAHCALAPYWAKNLGKKKMRAKQLSRRGGILKIHFLEDRVLIFGQATVTLTGKLIL